MRLWIAFFLISLFAFQALPLTALGKGCFKTKIAASAAPDEDGGEQDNPAPEPGKAKKSASCVEDYYLHPGFQGFAKLGASRCEAIFAPLIPMSPENGHPRLHIHPPDRH